jgi:hypothetical protein
MTIKPVRERLAEAKKLGADVKSVDPTGSTHFRIRLTYRGNERVFICGSSPSDRRSLVQWRADIKRWMRSISDAQENRPGT